MQLRKIALCWGAEVTWQPAEPSAFVEQTQEWTHSKRDRQVRVIYSAEFWGGQTGRGVKTEDTTRMWSPGHRVPFDYWFIPRNRLQAQAHTDIFNRLQMVSLVVLLLMCLCPHDVWRSSAWNVDVAPLVNPMASALWMIFILTLCSITERVVINVFVSEINFPHLLSAGDWEATVASAWANFQKFRAPLGGEDKHEMSWVHFGNPM